MAPVPLSGCAPSEDLSDLPGSVREIAEVIVFLCSDKAAYVTGQIIAVDGGFDAVGVGLPALRAGS